MKRPKKNCRRSRQNIFDDLLAHGWVVALRPFDKSSTVPFEKKSIDRRIEAAHTGRSNELSAAYGVEKEVE